MKKDKSKKKITEDDLIELSSPALEEIFDETPKKEDAKIEDSDATDELSAEETATNNCDENPSEGLDFTFNRDDFGIDEIKPAAYDEEDAATDSGTIETVETETNEVKDESKPKKEETVEEVRTTSGGLDEMNVRVGKTVVDTLIVNNMLGGAKGKETPVVNVTVQPEKKERKEYSVEDYAVPDSHRGEMVSAKGERVIKEYEIVKSSNSGKAIVTNRRLIIDSDYRLDIPIDKIAGISSSSRNLVNVCKIVFGALFIGICLFALLFDFNQWIGDKKWLAYVIISVGALFGLIGVILIATSFKKKFAINVYGFGLVPVMAISNDAKRAENNLLGSIVVASKGRDFDKFTGEFGALLLQIKDALDERL